MLNWLIRYLANRWSSSKRITKLNILTYHRVSEFHDPKNPNTITLALFEQQVKWLIKHFTVLPLPEALILQENNKLPPRAVCLTIDDGYQDSYDLIYKVLQKNNISATFFISTQGILEGGLWDAEIYSAIFNAPTDVGSIYCDGMLFDLSSLEDRIKSRYRLTEYAKYLSLKDRTKLLTELKGQTSFNPIEHNFLTEKQIKVMHCSGMTIAAHTHSHPILMKENNETAFAEIKLSKELLEQIIEEPVEYFAYPNGRIGQDYNEEHVDMVKKIGFKAALSTDWGSLTNLKLERFKIKRFTPWDKKEIFFALRLALNYRK
ncbi:polysaccharide deacetylase family protein [Colwellia psychrerythraea]|uniref:Polysaccharide deacetylase n=1 Tax=Colwellia psychrerythraea TaxID=28229 RepID=A0A099L1Q9_COLPS|nr:polysaccharide deacetylase family protein [Colwellia psychrerythraea]KGJ96781.1 polysaccharide deacetylase [Colwellia psychrerythraea]